MAFSSIHEAMGLKFNSDYGHRHNEPPKRAPPQQQLQSAGLMKS